MRSPRAAAAPRATPTIATARTRYAATQAYGPTRPKIYYDQYGNAVVPPPPAYSR